MFHTIRTNTPDDVHKDFIRCASMHWMMYIKLHTMYTNTLDDVHENFIRCASMHFMLHIRVLSYSSRFYTIHINALNDVHRHTMWILSSTNRLLQSSFNNQSYLILLKIKSKGFRLQYFSKFKREY